MENKKIQFCDKFIEIIFCFVMAIIVLLLYIMCIEDLPIIGHIVLIAIFSLCLALGFINYTIGIHFNYKLRTIKYLGTYKINKSIITTIKMDEVEKIDFKEVNTKKKNGIVTPKSSYVIGCSEKDIPYVYRNGKIFVFDIYLKNGQIIKIPYLNLFNAARAKRVLKQELKIKKIIEEFNLFIKNKDRNV